MSPVHIIQAIGLTLSAAVAVVVALFAFGGGATTAYHAQVLSSGAATTQAVIVDTRVERFGRRTAYYARYTYRDQAGNVFANEEELDTHGLMLMTVGARVPVRYSPSNPQISSIKSDQQLDTQRAGSGLFILVLLAAVVGAIVVAKFPALRQAD
jgi:hypothetical protein